MLFVNDNGRCATASGGRTLPNMRGKGVISVLRAFVHLEIPKIYPELQRLRTGTYNIQAFLQTHRRELTLQQIFAIVVMIHLYFSNTLYFTVTFYLNLPELNTLQKLANFM